MPVRTSRSTARTAKPQPKPDLKAVPDAQPDKPLPSETPKKAAKAKPEPKPTATVDLGAKPVTMWFPTAKLSDGETITCPHQRYGHESENAAQRCISALVTQHGHRVT